MVPIDARFIDRLRGEFLQGAMPSRLVRAIRQRHAGDAGWPGLVPLYLWEAFCVATLAFEEDSPERALDSSRDANLLLDMVRRAPLWRDPREPAWFDGVQVSADEPQLMDAIHPEFHPSLCEGWPTMPSPSRDFVRRAMVNVQHAHEQRQVLMRLVERLQQQFDAAEASAEQEACPAKA